MAQATDYALSEAAAAEFLGLSKATLRIQRCCGPKKNGIPEIPFIRMGSRCIRYMRSDLVDYINQNRVDGSAA